MAYHCLPQYSRAGAQSVKASRSPEYPLQCDGASDLTAHVNEPNYLPGRIIMKILLITLGVLVVVGIPVFLFTRRPSPVDKSLATYTGTIEDYRGDKKLVVVFTASWAGVWKLTAEALRKLDFFRYDLKIVDDATDRSEIKLHGITLLPTVALVENGHITKTIPNLMTVEQIKDW